MNVCDRHLSAANFEIWELQSADWSYGTGYLSAAYRVPHSGAAGTSNAQVLATGDSAYSRQLDMRQEGALSASGCSFSRRLGGPKDAEATAKWIGHAITGRYFVLEVLLVY